MQKKTSRFSANILDMKCPGAYYILIVATGVGGVRKTGRPGRARREIVRWIMHRNVVALADEEYDAMAAPLVDEACRIIRQIGGSRAYLLPVVIASLWPYAREHKVSQSAEAPRPKKTPKCHRPHLRIHTDDSEQD